MKRVRSLAHLMRVAQEKRAVIGNFGPLNKPRPASFIIGWPARIVHDVLKKGIYVYERKSK